MLHNFNRIVVEYCMTTTFFDKCDSKVRESGFRALDNLVRGDQRVTRTMENENREPLLAQSEQWFWVLLASYDE